MQNVRMHRRAPRDVLTERVAKLEAAHSARFYDRSRVARPHRGIA